MIATSVNFSQILLKIFSIGLIFGHRVEIENTLQPIASKALLAFMLLWIGLWPCKNNLFLGLILSLNDFGNSYLTIFAKYSPFFFKIQGTHYLVFLVLYTNKKTSRSATSSLFFSLCLCNLCSESTLSSKTQIC